MAANSEPGLVRAGAGALAGFQAGTQGVLLYLAWMGASAAWHRRTFWTAANLMATTFYGSSAIRPHFGWYTIAGIALYIILYAAIGAAFGALVRDRLERRRAILAGIAFGICWYALSFRLLWRLANPLIPMLNPDTATLLGHVLFGACLGRAARYLPPPPRDSQPQPDTGDVSVVE